MNRTELIKEIATRTEKTQKDVATFVDTFQDIIKEAVIEDGKVSLAGFLTFSKKHVEAKSGVTRLGGVEKTWSTPEKDEISVKISKSYKAI